MKAKNDYVTNSSSTSYLIRNISKTDNLTARAFIESIWNHIQNEMKFYEYEYSKEELIKSLEDNYSYFPLLPLEESTMIWGDEDYTIVGQVFDYVLRNGIRTGLVNIELEEYLR